jgi:hypothetical protein
MKVNLQVATPPPPKYSLTSEPIAFPDIPWIRASIFGIYCNKCCGQMRFNLSTDTDSTIDSFSKFHGECKSEWEKVFPWRTNV